MAENAVLVRQFQFNQSVLVALTKGFGAAEWLHRDGGSSHAYWILGHLAVCRRMILRNLLTVKAPKAKWEGGFDMGSKPGTSLSPKPAVLLKDFAASDKALARALSALTHKQAARKLASAYPGGADTVLGGVRFMLWHEDYHLGQLGLLRRAVGKKGMA